MFKDIVLAVTPSAVCECAADKAFSFAKRFDAKLYVVHVCGMAQGWGSMEYLEGSGETERLKENIEEFYKEKLKDLPHHEITVLPGIPHHEVLRVARRRNADLIVMGAHTKEYAEKRSKMWGMAGSTLERVAQRSRCPVMIVTREAPYGDQQFSRIVAATDFSEQAECAVAYAGQMCRHYKAELTVFHALEPRNMSQTEIQSAVAQAKERMAEEYGPRLAGLAGCEFECWEGDPAMEILKVSRLRKADLLIMAHHSKEEDPEKALLGSTVAQVALNAGCPTMSVNRHFDLRCGLMYDQTGATTSAKDAEKAKDSEAEATSG